MIYYTEDDFGNVTVNVNKPDVEEFKELVRRGHNTWERSSPEMKDFAYRVSGLSKFIKQST